MSSASVSLLAHGMLMLGFGPMYRSRDGKSCYLQLPDSNLRLRISDHPMPATAVVRNGFLIVHSELVEDVISEHDLIGRSLECAMRCAAMTCFRQSLLEAS